MELRIFTLVKIEILQCKYTLRIRSILLQEDLDHLGSTLSSRLLVPRCWQEKCSSVPTTIRLYDSSTGRDDVTGTNSEA